MSENSAPSTPGISDSSSILSAEIFGEPTGAAWDGAQLIFGDWLQTLFVDGFENGNATFVTQLAGYANFLASLLITVIVVYVMIAAVIKTASEGRLLGSNWSTVWLPMRVILGCVLILPIGVGNASTISLVQAGVAWLGMVGSNAADRAALFVASNMTKTAMGYGGGARGYQDIASMANIGFCNAGLYNGMEDYYLEGQGGGPKGLESTSPPLVGISTRTNVINTNSYVTMGGMGGVRPSASSISSTQRRISMGGEYSSEKLSYDNALRYGPNGECGSITINVSSLPLSGEKREELKNNLAQVVYSRQSSVYNNVVLPTIGQNSYEDYSRAMENGENVEILQNVTNSINEMPDEVNDFKREIVSAFSSSLNDPGESGYVEYSFDESSGQAIVSINQDRFSELGWAYLGAYYTILSSATANLNRITNAIEVNFDNPDGCSMTSDLSILDRGRALFGGSQASDEVCQYDREFLKKDIVLRGASQVNGRNENLEATERLQAACGGSSGECSPIEFERFSAQAIFEPFSIFASGVDSLGDPDAPGAFSRATIASLNLLGWGGSSEEIMGLRPTLDAERESGAGNFTPGALRISDPIAFTSNIGHTIVYAYNVIKGAAMTRSAATGAAGNSSTPIVSMILGAIGGALGFIIDYVMTVMSLVVVEGAIMAYFTPMLPSLIWGVAFISWLLMYAEAIFNSPLAVTLMATPEGEGISGSRMERQISLLAGLVLKPFLLVVGLLLSILILNIGFVFMNQIFWTAAGNSNWMFSSYDILSVTAFITIWFTIMLAFMHTVFKIIPTFADDSLQWFMGNVARNFGNDMDNVTGDKFAEGAVGSGQAVAKVGDIASNAVGRGRSNKSNNEDGSA